MISFYNEHSVLIRYENLHVLIERLSIPLDANWSPSGTTIINSLNLPLGLNIDQENGVIYVSDCYNNRVIPWKIDEQDTQDSIFNVQEPTDLLIDKETNTIIIADFNNERIVRFSIGLAGTAKSETIVDNILCWGLAMDDEGALYATDIRQHDVKRYPRGFHTGTVVAGGHGPGMGLHQLDEPHYIALDSEGSLYVSDFRNHRIVKWIKGSIQGMLIAGYNGVNWFRTQLFHPCGIVIDENETIYIADRDNHRILRYRKNEEEFSILIEFPEINRPRVFAFDRDNNMYVADSCDRVQRFAIIQ